VLAQLALQCAPVHFQRTCCRRDVSVILEKHALDMLLRQAVDREVGHCLAADLLDKNSVEISVKDEFLLAGRWCPDGYDKPNNLNRSLTKYLNARSENDISTSGCLGSGEW
jgi:hypothetical protein